MATMRQSANTAVHTSHHQHHHNNNSHDDNLDMLLEDLQTSVSRPGSSLAMNGPVTGGYREVTRTVTNQGINGPETSTEYQIEYLNPANSTTVIAERGASPNLDRLTDTSNLPPGSRKMASYKEVSTYQYKTSGGTPVHETSGTGDIRMRQNINELDSLLDDLHTAQKTGFSADSSSIVKKTSGYDSSLIEPLESSTPKGGHVSRSVEKKVFQEQRYGSVGRQSPARELKYDHSYNNHQEVSPSPHQRKEFYKYESKTTRSSSGGRELSPPSPPPIRSSSAGYSPSQQAHTVRSYNYTNSSDQDIPRTPTMYRSTSPTTHRSPSPAGRTVRSYNYSSNRTHEYSNDGAGYSHPQPPYRSPSPSSRRTYNYNTTTTSQESHRGPMRSPSPKTTVHSYNYSSSTKETKQETPKTPPPHRSPSPVSFVTPSVPNIKTTTVKTYNYEQSPRPQSPQPVQKFSPSDPSRTLNYPVSPPQNQTNVYSYKYSTHTTQNTKYPPEEHVPLLPRPFPTPSPTPDQQQQPPKKLDELMASFSDSEIHHNYSESNHRYTHQQPQQHPPRHQQSQPVVVAENPPPAPASQKNNTVQQNKSKNVAGPPVYYPPGVELFSKKEEQLFTQQQVGEGGGKMKAKAKAKYEYAEKSKSKEKSSTSKTVVPVCLPMCCAMPCVIM